MSEIPVSDLWAASLTAGTLDLVTIMAKAGSNMALTGKLRSWNDDRGFGFIAPRDGGRELFVHISAFPRDGSRPTVGETVSFELGRGKDGKPQAVKVLRQALGAPSTYPRASSQLARPGRSPVNALVGFVLVVAIGAFGYFQYQRQARQQDASAPIAPQAVDAPAPAARAYRCDGRTHCSQMSSCAEARFFLRSCPGVEMDGDGDGVPCEQQWCTSPFAR